MFSAASASGAMLLSFLFPVLSLASSSSDRTVYTLQSAPDGWTQKSRADASQPITLRINLPAKDSTALHSTITSVSTPGTSQHGKHLTREEAAALLAPSSDTSSAVLNWLKENGLTEVEQSAGGNVFWVSTTVEVAEKLIDPAEYYLYSDDSDPSRLTLQSLSWGVPATLANDVKGMQPTNLFPSFSTIVAGNHVYDDTDPNAIGQHLKTTAANATTDCKSVFTPGCAREHYGLGNYSFEATSKQSIAVYSEGGYANKSWQKTYNERWNPKYENTTWKLVAINTTIDREYGPDVEATLDLDIIVSLTAPTPVKLMSVAPRYWEGRAELTFVDYLLNLSDADFPSVVSMSYGWFEIDQFAEANLDTMLDHLCDLYGALGARGASVIVASGDYGVGGEECEKIPYFSAIFPSSCPYVTSVGATKKNPEVVMGGPAWGGGGGFSRMFARPSYQDAAVASYLSKIGNENQGDYNASGRGFPDVAAFGHAWSIYYGGWYSVGGTSASCPTVASIVAALNDYQLSHGKSTLGFLNPWIYGTTSKAWTDITEGSNKCGRGFGFNATEGWDATTGWGTPNFEQLVALLP